MNLVSTERATIELAREFLTSKIDGVPIWIRWYRVDRNGKGGGWEPSSYYYNCELVGVTEKRLRVKGPAGGVEIANPSRCYFATKVHA